MKKYLLPLMLSFGAANAATITYSDSFEVDETYASIATTQEVFPVGYLSTTFAPFDPSLGTLESFTVTWSLSGSFVGEPNAGGVSVNWSGNFLINGVSLPAAGGGGGGNGGPPGTPVTFDFPSTPPTFTFTYNVADAGTAYDSAILDALTGSDDVTFEWNTPFTITGASSNVTLTASAASEFTYTYSPIPEPSVALLGLATLSLGFIRRR